MLKKTIETFFKIVQIDSESGNEQKMIDFVEKWATSKDLIIKKDSLGNLLLKNKKIGKPVLFCAHLDTVKPGVGIKPVEKDGFIISSGNTILGADNKAVISALITAVEVYLQDKNCRPFEILFTVCEETGGGVEFFPFKWLKSKQGVIFDSFKPLGGIILRSPYIYNFHAEFKGKAIHSSEPNNGKNALIPVIKSLAQIKIGELDEGETTINIGEIGGGSGINIIPEKVKISGEVRSYNKEFFFKRLNEIERLIKKEAKAASVSVSFTKDGYCSGYFHKKSDSLIKKLKKIYRNLGISPKYYYFSGISDANILNSAGFKVINLGDGVENPHSTKEQIKIKNLIKLTEIILKLIKNL